MAPAMILLTVFGINIHNFEFFCNFCNEQFSLDSIFCEFYFFISNVSYKLTRHVKLEGNLFLSCDFLSFSVQSMVLLIFFFSYSNSHCFIIYHLNSVFSFHNDILLRIQTKSNRIVFMYNFMENVIILFPIHVVTGVKNNPSLTQQSCHGTRLVYIDNHYLFVFLLVMNMVHLTLFDTLSRSSNNICIATSPLVNVFYKKDLQIPENRLHSQRKRCYIG